jgi:hypothetical protein
MRLREAFSLTLVMVLFFSACMGVPQAAGEWVVTHTITVTTVMPTYCWNVTEVITLPTPVASSTTTLYETETKTSYTSTMTVMAESTKTRTVTETLYNSSSTVFLTFTSFVYNSTLTLPVTRTVSSYVETKVVSTVSTLVIPEFTNRVWPLVTALTLTCILALRKGSR